MGPAPKIPLVYALHSGNLYGTERMALYTASGLADRFDTTVLAPPGPLHAEAARLGFPSRTFESAREFMFELRRYLAIAPKLAFLATGVMHSLACLAWNLVYRRRIAHLHLVHGGADERLSYGRKRRLNGCPVRFVGVSNYVRERLIANGVRAKQITVIENFMSEGALARSTVRGRFTEPGIRRVAVISRLDPEKRVDLLLEMLERNPDLERLEISIFGAGWDSDALQKRARAASFHIAFEGFRKDVAEQLAASDLLVHLCPVEPFGLAVLEAMAAHVPVLVPDSGGAALLIEPGRSGFTFQANNAASLAEGIRSVDAMAPRALNNVILNARHLLDTRFSEHERIGDYRRLLMEVLA